MKETKYSHAIALNTMLIGNDLPELGTNLVTAL